MADNNGNPHRVVFDCNVLLQAMSNPVGAAGACMDAVRHGTILLCVSRDLLAEFEDVASRPELIRKTKLRESATTSFVSELYALGVMFDQVYQAYDHPIDPKDTMILNLAIAANARVITSRDRHLLVLRDVSDPAGREFSPDLVRYRFLRPSNC